MTKHFWLILAIVFVALTPQGALAAKKYERELTIAADGSGNFRTFAEAWDAIRPFMDYTVTVYIKNGIYNEKIIVPAWLQNIEFIGESVEGVIIRNGDYARLHNMGTFRTYTIRVDGRDLTFRNMTIENSAVGGGQAVALHTEGDRLRFDNVRLIGNIDTLYTGGRGAFVDFRNCYIEGTMDFIFGPSTAWFENCTIHSKANSYITAASTPMETEYGYIFKNCRLTAAPGVDKVYLGRPWRPYASTYFIDCEMGEHILSAGWHNWKNPENERTVRYGEYGSHGQGADGQRVTWSRQLTKLEADSLTRAKVFRQLSFWQH